MIEPKTAADVLAMTQAVEILLNHKIVTMDNACAMAAKIFDIGHTRDYCPCFHFLPMDGSIPWKINGWVGTALEQGLDQHGAKVVAFIKSRPPYGASIIVPEKNCWLVCAQQDMPVTQASAPKKPAPKQTQMEDPNDMP